MDQDWMKKSLVAAYNDDGKIVGVLPGEAERKIGAPKGAQESDLDKTYGYGDYGVGL